MTKWLWVPRPRPAAAWRLYCMAHAGAGASTFAAWASAAPPDIEIAAVQLPGRETRMDEEPLRRLAPAAASIAEAVTTADGRPFALFGHSVGGKLAVHVTALLETARPPAHVFISATPVVPRERNLHALGRDEFVGAISARFGELPAEITDDPDVWSVFERPMRGDLEAYETDELSPRRLDIALTIFHGSRDTTVDRNELMGWHAWSTRRVLYETVDADHFSYRAQPKPYLDVIARSLAAQGPKRV